MTLDAPLKSAQRRADPVDMWTTLHLAHIPTGEQNQKKRTYDVLPKPDNLIRYRQLFLMLFLMLFVFLT
jgi:hypothetical protein